MSSLDLVTLILLAVGLYPVVTGAMWMAGGLLFRLFEEGGQLDAPPEGWPGISILVPAFNEELVIAECVEAARGVDYPELEILILDDGSTDRTVELARGAAGDDPRVEVIRDPENLGKAERLNLGIRRARHELVAVTDADSQLDSMSMKLMAGRLIREPECGAVAGAPHVTNRVNLVSGLQVVEAAAVIGLIRRTQALSGRVGVVAGVFGLFRRAAVLKAGGYRGDLATEDIELSWRLLLAGWRTTFEPDALVGMEVPTTLRSLWSQRKRWARGQGEVLRLHGRECLRWQNRYMWPLVAEGLASLAWIVSLLIVNLVFFYLLASGFWGDLNVDGLTLIFAWGIAVSVVATFQYIFGLILDANYDRHSMRVVLIGPIYPLAYWMIAAAAALVSEIPALIRGPRGRRLTWDLDRDPLGHR